MLKVEKDPVYQYVASISEADKNAIETFFKERNYGTETRKLFGVYWAIRQGDVSKAKENYLKRVTAQVKFGLKLGLKEFNKEKQVLWNSQWEDLLKEAKAFFIIGDSGKAWELIQELVSQCCELERHEEGLIIQSIMDDWKRKSDTKGENNSLFIEAKKRLLELSKGQALLTELNWLWETYATPYISQFKVNGRADIDLVFELRRGLTKIDQPILHRKGEIQYLYMMGFVCNVYGDFGASQIYNRKIIECGELHPWLYESYGYIFLQAIYHTAIGAAERKEKDIAEANLASLNNGWETTHSFDWLWRYMQAGFTMVEVFWDSSLNRRLNHLFFENLVGLKANIPAHNFLGIAYALLKNKILLGQNDQKVSYLLMLIGGYSKAHVKIEIQVYSRIIEVILAWENGELEWAKKHAKNCLRFLKRGKQIQYFPQAIAFINFVTDWRSNLTLPEMTIRIENTRMALCADDKEIMREKVYFDIDLYLQERCKILVGVNYKHTS